MATLSTQQLIQKLQQISGMTPTNNLVVNPNVNVGRLKQAILDAQQVRDIALEQAKLAMAEMMKQETEKKKLTFLTIENIDKIRGAKYSEYLEVAGVKEWDNHYEFTLVGTAGSTQIETILLHRRQTDDKRYIMEYNGHTLWLTKDRLSSIDGILECMREI